MPKTPVESPSPDYQSFEAVVRGEKEPQRVHFIEILVDEEVKKFIIEKVMGEKYAPPAHLLFNTSLDDSKTNSEAYWKQHIDFYYRMGYDFLPDMEFMTRFQTLLLTKVAQDTAILSRGERHWAQEGKGMIDSWEDFEKFPWEKAEKMILDMETYYDFLSKNLPEGMGITVEADIHEEVLGFILGYEGLFYLTYDQPGLVKAVFDRMGRLVYDLYRSVAPLERIRVIFHADDLGFKTGTLLSPKHLRKWVFPWFKKYAAVAHEHGKMFWYHVCGDTRGIMEDLIEDIRIDAIHGFEDVIEPVVEFKKKYESRIATLGGVDMDKLCRLDEENLRRYVRNILDKCMLGGRYALGSGNSIANYIPVKNYFIMLEEGLKWR